MLSYQLSMLNPEKTVSLVDSRHNRENNAIVSTVAITNQKS